MGIGTLPKMGMFSVLLFDPAIGVRDRLRHELVQPLTFLPPSLLAAAPNT